MWQSRPGGGGAGTPPLLQACSSAWSCAAVGSTTGPDWSARRAVPLRRGARRHGSARRAWRSSRRRCGPTTSCDVPFRQWSIGNESHGVLLDDPDRGVAPGLRHAGAGDLRRRVVRDRRATPTPIAHGYEQAGEIDARIELTEGVLSSSVRRTGPTCGARPTCRNRWRCPSTLLVCAARTGAATA